MTEIDLRQIMDLKIGSLRWSIQRRNPPITECDGANVIGHVNYDASAIYVSDHLSPQVEKKTLGSRAKAVYEAAKKGGKAAGKFAGKHKATLITAGLVGAAGVGGGAISYSRGKKAGQSQD